MRYYSLSSIFFLLTKYITISTIPKNSGGGIIMTNFIFILGLLTLISCGKTDNSTGDPPQRDIVYQRALDLQSPLEDLQPHSIIRDKAMYRFAQGGELKGVFSLGDDYRFSLKNTFFDKVKDKGSVTIPYEIRRLALSSFENITLTLRRFDFEQNRFEPTEGVELLLHNIEGTLTQERRELTGNLIVSKDDIENNGLHFLSISRFVENGLDFQDRQHKLHGENARVYIHTSQGENVFYVTPGVSILSFLRNRFNIVSLSSDGSLQALGQDIAECSSLNDLINLEDDSNPRVWIQYPQRISEDDTFSAGEEYLFVHTSREEILSFVEDFVEERQFQNEDRWSYWRDLSTNTRNLNIFMREDFSNNTVVYKKNLKLGARVQLPSTTATLKGNLLIKDKAVYKFSRGLPLNESFSLGDDYRTSLNSAYIDNRILEEQLKRMPSRGPYDNIQVSYKLKSFNNFLVQDVVLSVKHFDFETEKLIPIAEPMLLREFDGSSVALSSGSNEQSGNLSINAGQLDMTKLNLVEISEFKEQGNHSPSLLALLYRDYARVYTSTSQGEEVFYVRPGTNIIDFLRQQFGEDVELSLDGELRKLGKDYAEFSSLKETNDVDDSIWIQHPSQIRQDDNFIDGKEYIFIYTSRRDVLLHAFGHTLRLLPESVFSGSYHLPWEKTNVHILDMRVEQRYTGTYTRPPPWGGSSHRRLVPFSTTAQVLHFRNGIYGPFHFLFDNHRLLVDVRPNMNDLETLEFRESAADNHTSKIYHFYKVVAHILEAPVPK